jgi:pimeloyl-ACP methyl ester carboxylesterase
MDDKPKVCCNARLTCASCQQAYLIPNPLDHTYDNPDPFHFTNSGALMDQLDAVVNDVRNRLGVDKVSLFAWSRGGLVVGPYSYLHPDKVENVVFYSSAYNFPANPPDELPGPGPSLGVQDRAHFEANWAMQVDNVDFPGQQDPAILDPIWQSIRARDPLGSAWGTDGLIRFPSADYWGWNPDEHQASLVTVPALVLIGELDGTLPGGPATAVRLYDDLGSDKKVLIKVDGGSHLMVWEGSTSPTWGGPHATLQDAAVQWITSETYRGATRGTFRVHGDGSIDQEPGPHPGSRSGSLAAAGVVLPQGLGAPQSAPPVVADSTPAAAPRSMPPGGTEPARGVGKSFLGDQRQQTPHQMVAARAGIVRHALPGQHVFCTDLDRDGIDGLAGEDRVARGL